MLTRRSLLTVTALTAFAVGSFAVLAPGVLLVSVKQAAPNQAANVMARTAGILLVALGVLNFLVRKHEPSPTLRAVLAADLLVQLGLLPVDPLAYLNGVFATPAAFVPNTLLHLVLASGFAYFLAQTRPGRLRLDSPR